MTCAREQQDAAAKKVRTAEREYETLRRNMRLLDLSDPALRAALESDLSAAYRGRSDAKEGERIAARQILEASSQWHVIDQRVQEPAGL